MGVWEFDKLIFLYKKSTLEHKNGLKCLHSPYPDCCGRKIREIKSCKQSEKKNAVGRRFNMAQNTTM